MNIDMQNNGNITIQLEPSERLQLASEFTKVINKQFEPMAKWFDDPAVPQKDKDPYSQNYTNAMAGMSFLYQLLQRCGYTDEQIKELAEIPF